MVGTRQSDGGFLVCSVAPSVQNSRPAQRRVGPKQGGAVLHPSILHLIITVRPDIDVLYQGLHQGLAVVRPSIPVPMCLLAALDARSSHHVPALLTSTPPEFQDWMRNSICTLVQSDSTAHLTPMMWASTVGPRWAICHLNLRTCAQPDDLKPCVADRLADPTDRSSGGPSLLSSFLFSLTPLGLTWAAKHQSHRIHSR